MSSIVKKVKMYNLRSRVIIGLVIIALSFLILFALLPKTTSYLTASKNVFAQPYTTLKNEKFYRGKTKCIIDWYADNDKGRFYLAPMEDANGSSGFLSVYVPKKYYEEVENIADQTWDYMETGDTSKLVKEFTCRGYITDLSGTARSYLEQYLRQADTTGNSLDRVSDKIFVVVPFTDILSGDSVVYILLMILFTGVGIYMIFSGLTGLGIKKFKQKLSSKGITADQLDADMVNSSKVGTLYIGDNYLVECSLNPTFHVLSDIVWYYPEKTNAGSNQTKYYATAYTRNHEKLLFPAKTESDSLLLCQKIRDKQPRALYGYVIENSTLYYSHFDELLKIVYDPNYGADSEAPAAETQPSQPDVAEQQPAALQNDSSWMNDPEYTLNADAVPMENVFKPMNDPNGSERSDDL